MGSGSLPTASLVAEEWFEHVHIDPRETLVLKPQERSNVFIFNGSARQLSYKVKTTRYDSVMPNRTYGSVDVNDTACIKVAYQPRANERRFGNADRVTIVLKPVPDPNVNPEQLWKEETHRFVLGLRQTAVEKQKSSWKQYLSPKSKKSKSKSKSKKEKSRVQKRSCGKEDKSKKDRFVTAKMMT